jgi:hypothetical protein
MRKPAAIVLVLAGVLGVGGTAHHDAVACGALFLPPPESPAAAARRAESLVSMGFFDEAARVVAQTTGARFRSVKPGALDEPLYEVLAEVIVRSGGRAELGEGWPSATDYERNHHVAWAVDTLEAIAAADPSPAGTSPRTLTALGVGLSKSYGREAEARMLLEALAADDLVTNAWGWAALARLRDAAGERDGAEEARRRCTLMTVEAICGAAARAPVPAAPDVEPPRIGGGGIGS